MKPTHAAAAVTAEPLSPRSPSLRATCWGTRGSIPSPGQSTALFGGNTPCLEVRSADGRCLVFDGGTGIRVLGQRLAGSAEPVSADLFLTHFHWDHIQGIPFFAPLYDAAATLRIHGPSQPSSDIRTLIAGQLGSVYFPVPFEALEADLSFGHVDEEPWERDGVEVAALRVRHPANTVGYRIRSGGSALAYIPDNELVGGDYPVGGEAWRHSLLRFLDGVDTLVHDAMYTAAELPARTGWGHSTHAEAVRLAEEAGVRRLYFFHHAPERTDAELLRILELERNDLARRGSRLELHAAAEGEELWIQEAAS